MKTLQEAEKELERMRKMGIQVKEVTKEDMEELAVNVVKFAKHNYKNITQDFFNEHYDEIVKAYFQSLFKMFDEITPEELKDMI